MAPNLSTEMRNNIVTWRYDLQKSPPECAALAGCSVSTVFEVLRINREFGGVHNPYANPRGGQRTTNTGDINYISALLEANPTIYLDEIQDRLLQYRNVDVSLATIWRAIRSLAKTHKKVSTAAMERNELLRAMWMAENGDIPASYIVWLDEASVDDRTNQRSMGWAALGRACVRRATFLRGQRFSVLPALTSTGIIALDIFEGSVTKERFINFLEKDLVSPISFSMVLRKLTCFPRHQSSLLIPVLVVL